MLRIILGKGEEKRIKAGHPWVFSNEIRELQGEREAGVTAEFFAAGGEFLGTGYYNPRSLIAGRLLSRERVDIDCSAFFQERLARALQLKQRLYPGWQTFRLVHGEGDFIPGLVVDKYGDYLSVQFLTAGMERRRGELLAALQEMFRPRGIIARNDVAVRAMEGLEEQVELLAGEIPELVEVEEYGCRFLVDLYHGQKTGHFLDQKENHLLLKDIVQGKELLDCFSYSGCWGVHAARYGAARVTCLDASAKALALARKNAALNGVDGLLDYVEEDAFAWLREMKQEGGRFDVIILDPPAFVKSRRLLKEAQQGYLTINRRAMELLRPGGYLLTCSCSYHMEREMFRSLVAKAAEQTGRQLRLLASRSQAPDHPVLLNIPETDYLKCLVLQLV